MNESLIFIIPILLSIVSYFVLGDYKLEKEYQRNKLKRKLKQLKSMSEEDYRKYKEKEKENSGLRAVYKAFKKAFKKLLFRVFIQIPWNIGVWVATISAFIAWWGAIFGSIVAIVLILIFHAYYVLFIPAIILSFLIYYDDINDKFVIGMALDDSSA